MKSSQTPPVRRAWASSLPERRAGARPVGLPSALCRTHVSTRPSPTVHAPTAPYTFPGTVTVPGLNQRPAAEHPHLAGRSKSHTLTLRKDSFGQLTGGISGFHSEFTVSPPVRHAGDRLWGTTPWKRQAETRGAHRQALERPPSLHADHQLGLASPQTITPRGLLTLATIKDNWKSKRHSLSILKMMTH